LTPPVSEYKLTATTEGLRGMKSSGKLTGEARREAIIRAVRRVFAERGFHGTTTKALADAAGVSEALLFKHFPTKEALYSAMQAFCSAERDPERLERIKAMEPSTATLVVIVHLMVARIVRRECGDNEETALHHQLMLRSMMEDGEFARLFFHRSVSCWLSKVQECLDGACIAGDATCQPVRPDLGGIFTHHLAKTLMLSLLPATPVVDYDMPLGPLIEQAVWFSLRGMGVKDEAIRRHYRPENLAVLAG
jgi:AcrR family transcriptional regulator